MRSVHKNKKEEMSPKTIRRTDEDANYALDGVSMDTRGEVHISGEPTPDSKSLKKSKKLPAKVNSASKRSNRVSSKSIGSKKTDVMH